MPEVKDAVDQEFGLHKLDETISVELRINCGDEGFRSSKYPDFKARLSPLLHVERLKVVNDGEVVDKLATA